ncbi:MAG: stage III sporulation protein AF [Clostridia bacterium]
MVSFLSSWVKNLSLAIVIVSILEMLLPNNKTKKYIKMIMGLYILFSIISPFIQNGNIFNLENLDFNTYLKETQVTSSEKVGQTSTDKRLNEIYIEQLENDITQKLENKGYVVEMCDVDAYVSQESDNSGINKITLKINKTDEEKSTENNDNLENKLISEIKKIQKVDIKIDENQTSESEEKSNITKTDIENVKSFLISEYGVSKTCLKIN